MSAHEHAHHHNHSAILTHVNTAFIVGITLNFLFVLIEVFVGLFIHSLSLLSDAGHNLADVGSLALSLLAFRMLKVRANKNYTYGYRKTSILEPCSTLWYCWFQLVPLSTKQPIVS